MSSPKHTFEHDICLVLGGSAGQGLQTIEKVLTRLLRTAGYHTFSTSEYMSRVRGGSNSTEIRVSDTKRSAFVQNVDIVFALDGDSFERLSDRYSENTIVVRDSAQERDEKNTLGEVISLPILKTAEDSGGKILMNTVVAGMILAIFELDDSGFREYLSKVFQRKGEKVVQMNIEAAEKGKKLGERLRKDAGVAIAISHEEPRSELMLDGSEAIALGAVAGGCDFVSSYPMSPSTAVLTKMSEHSQELAIAVEQVEDEITAINMAIGAWFSGARALVTTSGGGFALMAEAMSLAGMTENPVVIHLAHRPGPATGLPTRTEQGDLNFALHTGHGDFPRAILTPGTPEECFIATKKAFDLADKYQVPVIVMTDQFLLDSHEESEAKMFDVGEKAQKYFIETDEDYKRYAYSDDGLSPRGLPGFGQGFVHADSDEHNEDGRIIEDADTRTAMMEKRMHRLDLLSEEALSPVYFGIEDPSLLVIGWGSTYGAIREALDCLDNRHLGYMHVSQAFPVSEEIKNRIKTADRVLVIENNMTGQYADLLTRVTGCVIDHRILSYDGWPFAVEDLAREIGEIVA